jgi:tetratricopeptide (TPR) repeat protein
MFVDSDQNKTGLSFAEKVKGVFERMSSPTYDAKRLYGLSLNAKCLGLQRLDRIEEAKQSYDFAFKYANDLPAEQRDELLGKLYLNRGVFRHFILKATELALEDFKGALEISRITKNKGLEGMALLNVALSQKGDERIKTTLDAIEVLKALGNSPTLALAYNNITGPLTDKKDYEKATEAALRALEIARNLKNIEVQGRSLLALASIAEAQNQRSIADNNLEEAERIVKQAENIDLLSFIYDAWAEIYVKRKDGAKGTDLCEKWLKLPLSDERKQKVEKRKEEFLRLLSPQDI